MFSVVQYVLPRKPHPCVDPHPRRAGVADQFEGFLISQMLSRNTHTHTLTHHTPRPELELFVQLVSGLQVGLPDVESGGGNDARDLYGRGHGQSGRAEAGLASRRDLRQAGQGVSAPCPLAQGWP